MACKNWCFTLNNPTDEETEDLRNLFESNENIQYLVFQTECENTIHHQGFIQLKVKKAMSTLKEYLGDRVHLEKTKGTPLQAAEYCQKEDTRLDGPFEFGTISPGKGARNDIKEFTESMKENLLTESQIIDLFPAMLAKYPRYVKTLTNSIQESKVIRSPLVPRPGWQSDLHTVLQGPAHNRQVTWYIDEVGNTGKSTFAREWRCNGQSGFIITGGRHQDIYYAYERQSVVFIDLARVAVDKVPYEVMENFKNGGFLSTKYESKWVMFNIPHVIVFSNFQPDQSKLSEDRWNIINI